MKPHKIFLILILVLAFILRAYRLDTYPPINPDEAAIGYNAYSLLQTGRDEHGNSWPIHFKSFGDYKPGGYFYLVLPFVKLIGPNLLAVRLPNLILSILTIYFLYKLVFLWSLDFGLSALSSFVLALSPWHIHFSRGGWESSAALSFIIIGLYFFFKYLKKLKTLDFLLFILFFVLSLYTYHSARIIAPLLAISLFVIHKSDIINLKSKIIMPILFGILITLPLAYSFFTSGGSARFGGVGLLADSGPLWRANELLNHHGNVELFNRVIHNQRLLYLISWAQKYSSHFNFNFLYLTGDSVPRSKVPDLGQFYLFEFPFFLFGLYFFLRSTIYDLRSKLFILFFLLIAPLASSLTFQAPSALRALSMTIPFSIITAYGLYQTYRIFSKNYLLRITYYVLLLTCYTLSLAYYFDSYYTHYPSRYPNAWSYGFDQLIPYLQSQKSNYPVVYVTDKYDQPYILYLFYSLYPPTQIQSQIKLSPPDQYGFSTVRNIDNIHFQNIVWDQIPPNSLVVADDQNFNSVPIKVINFPNGSPAFKIYTK